MKFLVCVKQVVDTSQMEVDPATGRLKRNNANSILNPMDRNALEAALSLRDQTGGRVTVISMGPPQAAAVLKEAISMGADEAYLVTDRAFGGADTLATSYTLASAIRKIGSFDLIFCGMESIDSNTAQIGPEIAATCTGELNKPRYPSIKGILKKDEVEIHNLTAADLPVDAGRIGMKGSPTQVRQVRPVVPPKKENLRIEGKPAAEAVEELFGAMRKLNLV